MIPKWLNNQGWIVGWQENGDYMVRMPDGTMIKLLDRAYGISDEDEDGLVTLACGEYLYKQCYREDPDTGEITPLPAFERFHLAEDIFQSQKRVSAHGISENGILLLGVSGVASAGISGASEPASEPFEENGEYVALEVDLAVDKDRDGDIEMGIIADDRTTQDDPYVFWVNNDNDEGDDDKADDRDPNDGDLDSADGSIDSIRDLEDFTRLDIDVSSLITQLKSGSLKLGLKFRNVQNSSSPELKLWRNLSPNGGNDYLFDASIASQHKGLSSPGLVTKNDAYIIPTAFWNSSSVVNGTAHLLFEGAKEGFGELYIEIYDSSDTKLGDGTGTWIDLKDVKQLYQHWTVGDFVGSSSTVPATTASEINGVSKNDLDNMHLEDDYIVFVHGWRMRSWERRAFAETAFKRLYWQGYKGRFGLFSWPTGYTDLWWDQVPLDDPTNYSRSEEIARNSSDGLESLLKSSLKSAYRTSKVRVFAHSMGNVVVSEALRNNANTGGGMITSVFVASQAATVAHAYDSSSALTRSPLTLYGWDTPESYASYHTTGRAYYDDIGDSASSIINFHNKDDNALNGWEFGQDTKPDSFYDYEYVGFDFTEMFWTYDPLNLSSEPHDSSASKLFFPADRYEIFAHIAEARSKALGAEPSVSSVITSDVNLNSGSFGYKGERHEHSAQFLSDNMKRQSYWEELLVRFGIVVP